MKRFALFLLGLATIANAATWVFDRDILEQRLPLGVTIEELTSVLENEGVEVCFKEQEDLVLWRGTRAFISLAASPFAPYHLWIGVEGRKTLDECTTNELAELYEAIWKGRKAVAETTGATGFMIFTTEEMRNGKGTSSVGFEIIPSGFNENSGVMDAVEKNLLNEYVFYNQFPFRSVSHNPETVLAIRALLSTLEPEVVPEKPQGMWTQKFLHHAESIHQNLEWIHDILAQSGALIKGEMPSLSEETGKVHEILIDLDKCAFCNPKVIQKQVVYEKNGIYVLMSHKPISPYGNFLILPKRHQCSWDLTRDEAVESLKAVSALKKMFNETTGLNNWICYVQNGPTVGQTVPHTTLHFFILPDRLKLNMTALQHINNQRPVLSYEEMRANCEKVKQLLQPTCEE
ncbi:MAG: HIT domain-containing protein [Chlamydiia bacterium]|nr:HIT domain-containing protein [Chlamydiia bacterium]